jgi:hypothetical protein
VNYEEFELRNYRRAILRFLLKRPDGLLNESLLVMELESEALFADQTKRRAEISFLFDRGLVTMRFVAATMLIQLTERGRIVALGKEHIDGIADTALPTG